MSTFDLEQDKASQRQGWDIVASGWQKWWKTIEIANEKVSRRLIELAAIKEGSRVLDSDGDRRTIYNRSSTSWK
jgi:hypothetical protein